MRVLGLESTETCLQLHLNKMGGGTTKNRDSLCPLIDYITYLLSVS